MTDKAFPDYWLKIEVGEISLVVSGGTPKANNPANFKKSGEGIAWITPADLSGYKKKGISNGKRDLTQQGYNSCSAKLLPKGTILFSSRAPIGYVVIAKNEMSTNQGFKSFIFPEGVETDYAYYYFNHIVDIAKSVASGTTFKELSATKARKLPFLLPPLGEQKEIANKLKVLVQQIDDLKTRIDALPNIIKQFRESVLSDAVNGKLTNDLRDGFGISAWKNVLLKDDALKFSYGTSSKSSKEGEIPVLRMGNIQGGKLEWDNLVFTSDDNEIEKYKLKKGDILFNRTNSPKLVGKTAIYLGEQEAIYAGYLIKVVCGDNLFPKFLNIHLNSPRAREYCKRVKSDGVSQSNINAKKLAAYSLSLPPMEEQIEIVNRVENLFSFADNIEQQVETIQSRVENITPFVLKKAFQGELTAEWRTKNPSLISRENSAKRLFEQIKFRREEQIKASKHKRTNTKKKTATRKKKVIIPIMEALKELNQAISASELLIQSGYPQDATTIQLESFFLDIRQQLEDEKISCERKNNEDYFMLENTVDKQ